MMKYLVFVICMICSVSVIYGEDEENTETIDLFSTTKPVEKEEAAEVQTDSIDIFQKVTSKNKKNMKSQGVAMSTSLALPGLGHTYLGKKRRAFTYFALEGALITGVIVNAVLSRKVYQDSRAYAFAHAGIRSGRHYSDDYWSHIGQASSYKEYNSIMDLNGESASNKYLNDGEMWQWGSDNEQDTYRGMRSEAARYSVAAYFFVGGMILNRVVSFIDARSATKVYNSEQKKLSANPSYSVKDRSVSLHINGEF